MYVIDENVSEVGGGKFIKVSAETCVDSGRFLDAIEFDAEKLFLDVLVKDATGKTAKKRYFLPKLGGMYTETQEKYDAKAKSIVSLITNISRTILGDDVKLSGTSLEDLVSKAVTAIKKTAFQNKEVWCKVILDAKNFPTLPNVSPVMYPATLTKEQVTAKGLRYTPGVYDKVVNSEQPTPTEEVPATKPKSDDLPF